MPGVKKRLAISAAVVVIGVLVGAYFWFSHRDTSPRSPRVDEFIRNPLAHQDWTIQAGARCGSAPFVFPTAGFIGYLWGDTFDPSHLHQGIDIFGGDVPGVAPVYAAADPDGNSQISPAFPPGTREVFIAAGTLLGYQGNYSGTPGQPVGVHLHFSIVQDDGRGGFRNELNIENTLDPSPYLGLNLNAAFADALPPLCAQP
jgi:hypothetical protein